jgi:hypothetical protein
MPSAEFKCSIPSMKRLQTYGLGRTATGTETTTTTTIMWNVKTKMIPVITGANGTI